MYRTPCDVAASVLRGVFLSELVVGCQQTWDGQAESSARVYSVITTSCRHWRDSRMLLSFAPHWGSSGAKF
jgi:hypothetical protein